MPFNRQSFQLIETTANWAHSPWQEFQMLMLAIHISIKLIWNYWMHSLVSTFLLIVGCCQTSYSFMRWFRWEVALSNWFWFIFSRQLTAAIPPARIIHTRASSAPHFHDDIIVKGYDFEVEDWCPSQYLSESIKLVFLTKPAFPPVFVG